MKHLGYAPYVLTFLSVAKLLGSLPLYCSGYKGMAYAGFTLIFAELQAIAVGDPVSAWAPLLLGLVFITVSYIYWHKKLALRGRNKALPWSKPAYCTLYVGPVPGN